MSEQRVAAPPSPYKGLAPFEDSPVDALLFFGRERESEIVAANLLAYRLTVLYGASGVGKSSLIGAGVAHRLRRAGEAVVVFKTWSGDAVTSLLAEVQEALESPDPPVGGLAASLAFWTTSTGRELYLILDQFDEYFLYHEGDGDLERELAEVVTRQGLRVNVLISIRDDVLSRLDSFKTAIPNLFSNFLRLDHLDPRSAREAIVRPLDRYNALVPVEERVSGEPELVEAVLAQSETHDRIEAPYLQLVMQRLWEEERHAGSRTLSRATLERLGGAEEIVRAHLVEALEGLPERDRDLAAELFNHLVTPSGTKIAHRAGDLAQYASVSEEEVVPVLAALMDERIVRPVTVPGVADGSRYEIFHDVLAEPVVAWRSGHRAERELARTRAEARRRHRRLLVLAGAALLAVAVMAGVTVYAFSQRSAARAEAKRANARELAARALGELQVDPQQSLRLALAAARLAPSGDAENTLRSVLVHQYERLVLRLGAPVRAIAFSPNGRRFAAAIPGAEVSLYTGSGRLVTRVGGVGGSGAIAFSPDGRRLAAVTSRTGIRLLDGKTGEIMDTLPPAGPVSSVAYRGGFVAAAGGPQAAHVWRPNGATVSRLRTPQPARLVELSRDGGHAAVVARDRGGHARAWVFAARTGRLLHELPAKGITAVAISPSGNVVATGSADRTARLWNARSGRELYRLHHAGAVVAVHFSRDGDLLATASEDGVGRVWDARTGALVAVLPGATQPLRDIDLSDDGRFAVTASGDGNAYVYRVADGLLLATLAGAHAPVTNAVFGPRAATVLTGSDDGTVRVWAPNVAAQLRLVRRVPHPVVASFAPEDGSIRVRSFHGAQTAATSPNGRYSARTERSSVLLTDRRTGKTQPLRGHFGTAYALGFSPDSRWLVTGGQFAAILWRLADGRAELFSYLFGHAPTFHGRAAHLTSVAFSPDGRRVITASLDRTVRVYDCEVCGGLDSLVRLAERRLARISPPK